ncbi:hypothetical protein NIES2100_04690 [Calothrix sp. NIES-2100]|uniref:CTB family bacteriocin n=1 Tax=Calothrix sp. NIES-2100 TaxID=1954172 RepID=UPI000B5E2463|nr:hypothetical protein NIES2100_04690 [Calothrix sp. NIES-2100]
MSNETNINNTPVELSPEELDAVAGGIDIYLSGSTFEQRDIFSANRRSYRRNSRNSIFQSSYISSSAFQFIGLGFNSVSDALSFVSGFAKLFGRR